jgi:hypothetical protein
MGHFWKVQAGQSWRAPKLNLGKSNKNKGYWLKKSTATDDVGVG